MERRLFFENGDHRLFGVVHDPHGHGDGVDAARDVGIVFCAPFGEEKIASHRILLNMARRICGAGFLCLRFDYMGHGDSSGDFEEATVATRLSDIRAAIAYLRRNHRVERVGLVGFRFGGTLAALTCLDATAVDSLVLVSPITDGKAYVSQLLRANMAFQMSAFGKTLKGRKELIEELKAGKDVCIEGYLFTKRIYEEMVGIHLLECGEIRARRIGILEVVRNIEKPVDASLEALQKALSDRAESVRLSRVEDDFFWKDGKNYVAHAMNTEDFLEQWFVETYG